MPLLLLQAYRPLQRITWPWRPTGEAPTPSCAPVSGTPSDKLIVKLNVSQSNQVASCVVSEIYADICRKL